MGRFASAEDVISRFEGQIPSDREAWIETRIDDVEADLMLMVPSLEALLDGLDEVPLSFRLQRAKSLVCDKVLDLYRNPERSRTRTSTVGSFSESVTGGASFSPGGYFTADEVRSLRQRARRTNLGTAKLLLPDLRPQYGYRFG